VLFARRLDDYSTNDPAWRASLADALHRYCESVLMQVPRNTPEQDRWVDSEMKFFEGDSAFDERYQRLKRVQNSVEYARKNLRYFLSGCSSLTKNLIELKPTTPIKEALLWLRLSDYIGSPEVVLPLAEIAGMVSRKYYCNDEEHPPGAHDENYLCSWSFVHISIIRYAVIPLLEGSGGQ
jgi:hypothetical protein